MKTMLLFAAVVTAMLGAVAACGRRDAQAELTKLTGATMALSNAMTAPVAGSAKASCSMEGQLGTCNEYRNGSSFGLDKSLCEGYRGTFEHRGCTSVGQIAFCTMSDGEVKRYYGPAVAGARALSLDEAKADCASDVVSGVFVAQ